MNNEKMKMNLLQIDAAAKKLIGDQKLLSLEGKELFQEIMFFMGFNEGARLSHGFIILSSKPYASILFLANLADERRGELVQHLSTTTDDAPGYYLSMISNILNKCDHLLSQEIVDKMYSAVDTSNLGLITNYYEENVSLKLVEDLLFSERPNPNTFFCLKPLLNNHFLEIAIVRQFFISFSEADKKEKALAISRLENNPVLMESVKKRADEFIKEDDYPSCHYYIQLVEVAQGNTWIIDLISKSMEINHDADANEEKRIFKIQTQIGKLFIEDDDEWLANNIVRDEIKKGYDYISRNLDTHDDMKIFMNHKDFDSSRLNKKLLKRSLLRHVLSSDMGI